MVGVARLEGMSNATIATDMGTSPETALSHDAEKVAARDLAMVAALACVGSGSKETTVTVTDVVFATIELECATH